MPSIFFVPEVHAGAIRASVLCFAQAAGADLSLCGRTLVSIRKTPLLQDPKTPVSTPHNLLATDHSSTFSREIL